MTGFNFARCPAILFGAGVIRRLGEVVSRLGRRVVLVTGTRSLEASGHLEVLKEVFRHHSLEWHRIRVSGEPSPETVDRAVDECRSLGVHVVVAVGGGSAIDTGKAVSAMLPGGGSVLEHLEGSRQGAVHSGEKTPFVAVPTTAGTGSEATKNAVLSRVGPGGFKRSLRHDNFVPDVALVDPELTLGCPPDITAACGMDALTQLLESYVSTGSSPLTDALALSGLGSAGSCLLPACASGAGDIDVRAGMAYAALLSGMTLANAGLGVVHGFASAIGALFDVPHGVVCGTLIGAATEVNIRALLKRGGAGGQALEKYGRAGALLCGGDAGDTLESCRSLVGKLEGWTQSLRIPLLREYGISADDIDEIVERTEMKDNPVDLSGDELRDILLRRV